MISIEKFTYHYPGAEKPALLDLDLKIPKGQFCGVVGANGAGKSTLCYALSGFVPHFFQGEVQGRIMIAKKDMAKSSLGELAGKVGLVFQNPFNQISGARFTVREEIAFGLENLGLSKKEINDRLEETLESIGLEEIAERSPFALSGGQQQRVAVASVLAMRPQVLVLDEPTAQLDPHGTEDLFAALSKLAGPSQITVVLVEHKLEWLAAFVDRVIALDKGQVVMDGSPQKVLSTEKMITLGVGRTQYTEAAERAHKAGLKVPSRPAPVTLKQARAFFK